MFMNDKYKRCERYTRHVGASSHPVFSAVRYSAILLTAGYVYQEGGVNGFDENFGSLITGCWLQMGNPDLSEKPPIPLRRVFRLMA